MATWFNRILHRGDGQVTIDEASKIIGVDKTYKACEVFRVWHKDGRADLPVSYSKKMLEKARKSNDQGLTDIRLIYIIGFLARQMYLVHGTATENSVGFFEDSRQWLELDEPSINETLPSGYYLLDFKPKFSNLTCLQQDRKLHKIGSTVNRASISMVMEALFTIQMLRSEFLLYRESHTSPCMDPKTKEIRVGYFDKQGLTVTLSDTPRADCGVVTYLRHG
jgi:hypothetical protein